jgi:hypothetical protein
MISIISPVEIATNMAPNKKVEECVTGIMTNILKLSKMKVPCVVAFHHQGKSQQFGTQFARQHLHKSSSDLRRALEKDALALCSRNADQCEPLLSTNIQLTDKENAITHLKKN